ncbi:GumC family protein [Pokkaliibacter sp. CJK22405]|uniref:GumC family protein n=1 Tax=Pokkaliibacter sp. CJK22405 TaxID=3384615 RepID=UPI003984D5BC
MTSSENYLHEFLRIFFANQRLIKRVFLGFFALTCVAALLMPTHYDVGAEVVVQSKKLSQLDPSAALTSDTDKFVPPTLADMETESAILRSPSLIRATLEPLVQQGVFSAEPGLLSQYVIQPIKDLLGVEPSDPLASLTDQTLDALDITPIPGSNVIGIHYQTKDTALGVRVVNALLDQYLLQRQNLQSSELPTSFFGQKREQYEHRLRDLEDQRLALLRSHQAADPSQEIALALTTVNSEQQALDQARDLSLQQRHRLEFLNRALKASKKAAVTASSFPLAVAGNGDNANPADAELTQLSTMLNEQIARYGTVAATYQSGSIPEKQARAEIERTRQQLAKVIAQRISERQNELAITEALIDQKDVRIQRERKRVEQLQQVESGLRQLDTQINALQAAYSSYTQRFEESKTQQQDTRGASNARILSRPYPPTKPSTPSLISVIIFGAITGLLLALAAGYIREFFDHRFKHPAQIASQLDLPVLMVINETATEPTARHRRGSKAWWRQWLTE